MRPMMLSFDEPLAVRVQHRREFGGQLREFTCVNLSFVEYNTFERW
jgi:hypothetical protein